MALYDHAQDYERFLGFLQARCYAAATIAHYSGYARTFHRWCREVRPVARREQRPDESDARDFLCWIAGEKGMARSSYNVCFNAIRHYFSTLLDQERVDIGDDLRPQRRQATAPRVLTVAMVGRLLAAVEPIPIQTVLTLMYGTGMRLREAIHLRLADIEQGTGMLIVAQGKGGKQRRIAASPGVLMLLRAHWRLYKPVDYMFTRDGRPESPHLSAYLVQSRFRDAKARVGCTARGSTHLLRHCFAHHQLQAGCDIRSLQAALGHNDLSTTMRYLGDLDALSGHRPPTVDLLANLPAIDQQPQETQQ